MTRVEDDDDSSSYFYSCSTSGTPPTPPRDVFGVHSTNREDGPRVGRSGRGDVGLSFRTTCEL